MSARVSIGLEVFLLQTSAAMDIRLRSCSDHHSSASTYLIMHVMRLIEWLLNMLLITSLLSSPCVSLSWILHIAGTSTSSRIVSINVGVLLVLLFITSPGTLRGLSFTLFNIVIICSSSSPTSCCRSRSPNRVSSCYSSSPANLW